MDSKNVAEVLNDTIKEMENIGMITDDISDGSHTFRELYNHRMILFAIVCESYKGFSWKSLKHSDGTMFADYFIVGLDTPKGQFTYHYNTEYWDYFDVEYVEYAPEWDGHNSDDITRLFSLLGD